MPVTVNYGNDRQKQELMLNQKQNLFLLNREDEESRKDKNKRLLRK